MKTKRIIKPRVVAGGAAIPIGENFYYMSGRKHKDGGIDIGKNDKTGLEVEDGEVMHLTNKEVKVFSSVPFLAGKSPSQKILEGDNPTKVFNAQEDFKDVNKINDDGTSKQNRNKMINKIKYAGGGKKRNTNTLAPIVNTSKLYNYDNSNVNDITLDTEQDLLSRNTGPVYSTPINTPSKFDVSVMKAKEKVGDFINNNTNSINDGIGIASNVVEGIIANKANNKMLNKLKYSSAPIGRQATKLKTKININPQLDKMRESIANYERDIDNNTASSRVALARKQNGRVANMLQTNELYGNKENLETDLINKDKLNQQQVDHANLSDYNNWSQGKTQFDNTVAEKRSENTIGLIDTLNSSVQDIITRGEKRKATRENMLAISASHPNVNPRILKELGVKSITDKDVENWDKANSKNKKKSKG